MRKFGESKKRWCKLSSEAKEIGYKENRDGVIIGEIRKGEWRVIWGGNRQPYYYAKNLIEELDPRPRDVKIKGFIHQLPKEAEERGQESVEFDLNKLQEMTYRNEAKSEVIASREEIKNALKEVHGGGNGRRLLMTLLFKLDELSK